MNSRKILTRAISGIIYIAIIVGCILWGMLPFTFMAAIFAVIACLEFEKITGECNSIAKPAIILDLIAVVFLVFSWQIIPLFIWIAVMITRMIVQLYLKGSKPLEELSVSFTSQIYIALPLALMTCLGSLVGLHLVLGIFIMIWLNDTGAFIVGSLLGRHRLFERISPKKSWEGFLGGLIFNIVAAILFCLYGSKFFIGREVALLGNNMTLWIILGIIVTVFATWGDLVESMIKRSLHIKDSGNIMPGHGGILDRIDSLLFVMPASFLYLLILELFF